MVYGIYSSAAGLQVNQYRQEVLANNLANVATAGFKQDLAVIRERRPASLEELGAADRSAEALAGLTGGSFVAPTYTSFAAGASETTGNPLDVAINGEGFFRVLDGQDERYTRDGRFTLNDSGELMTVTGRARVLSDAGQPIRVPPGQREALRIDANGEVRSGDTRLGRIDVVEFDDRSLLRKTGANLLQSLGAKAAPVEPVLQTGTVEQSNVDPTRAMVAMLEVARAYQLNATMVGLADTTLGRAVNDIARVK